MNEEINKKDVQAAEFYERLYPEGSCSTNYERTDLREEATENFRKRNEIERVAGSCTDRVSDRIRGSLMVGAAGDALGYAVEFRSRHAILAAYGEKGITAFELDPNGKAPVSDDTQMTLFTANGLLTGVTHNRRQGADGLPDDYAAKAYLDWYYTQTGRKTDAHYTWLRDLPQLAHRRAPGITCLNACEDLFQGRVVQNNSKGCGGIMRVAPVGLFAAAQSLLHGDTACSLTELATAGAEVASATHKHPLGFLPAALMTVLLYKLVSISPDEVRAEIDRLVEESLAILPEIYPGKYEQDKKVLRELTMKTLRLAHSDVGEAEAIRQLGEGWVAEEAWAVALFCSVRHIDSVKDALIAAVNHDGDSDSTGSIAGNIMGAIYGYKSLLEQNLCCPAGHKFEETLELHDLILALADDLTSGCIIGAQDKMDTSEKQQWYERYVEMRPSGIVLFG